MTQSPFILEESSEQHTATTVNQAARIIEDTSDERIVIDMPKAQAVQPSSTPPRSYRWPIVLFSIGVLGWAGISLGNWVVALAETNWIIGLAGGICVAAITAGALLWIGSELKSLRQLQKVDKWHSRLSMALNDAPATHSLIAEIGKALPNTPTTTSAVAVWTRHAPGYRSGEAIETFDKMFLGPLDTKALAVVRRATRDAFGLVALSPTLIIDTVVFTARAVSLVRAVAEVYGHRPGYAATLDLMRKIAGSVGMLVASDFVLDAAASAASSVAGNLAGSSADHIAGTVAGAAGHVAKSERFTKAAAEGAIAAQRMGRLGLLAIYACRPLPFREGKKPGFRDILLR
jgi:putative membrane protein